MANYNKAEASKDQKALREQFKRECVPNVAVILELKTGHLRITPHDFYTALSDRYVEEEWLKQYGS